MRSIEHPTRDTVKLFGQTVTRPPSVTIPKWQDFWEAVKKMSEGVPFENVG